MVLQTMDSTMPPHATRQSLAFRSASSPMEEMQRLQRLRQRDPTSAANVVANGSLMVALARDGELRALADALAHMQEERVLTFYAVRMFREACASRRVDMLRFMVTHGLDVTQMSLRGLLHELIEGIADCSTHEKNTDGPDADAWQPTLRFLLDAGMDVNWQRKSDLYTALHLACQKNLHAIAYLLLLYGADVNAIALNDDMPLRCAERLTPLTDAARHQHTQLLALLADCHARRTWRKPQPGQGTLQKNQEGADWESGALQPSAKRPTTQVMASLSASCGACSSRPSTGITLDTSNP